MVSEATSSLYFYMAGESRRGPFPFDEFLQQPVHRHTPVWCKGMGDWQPAGDVPELSGLIPPPPPLVPPVRRTNTAAPQEGFDLGRYVVALRRLNHSLLGLILASLVLSMLSGQTFAVVYVVVAVAWVVVLWKAAIAAGVRWPLLWAALGIAPLIGYVPLIVLHNRLKRPLEAAGYRIRFLGQAAPKEVQP